MNYCESTGRYPNPVPIFLEEIFPSFSRRNNLSLKRLTPIPRFLAFRFSTIQSVGTIASLRHSFTASKISSSVTTSSNTIIDNNTRFSYIGFSLLATSCLCGRVSIRRYIYLKHCISTIGVLMTKHENENINSNIHFLKIPVFEKILYGGENST